MASEFWKAFYLNGEQVYSYALASETREHQQAVIDHLVFEHKCHPNDIGIYLVECVRKQYDFKRDCAFERIGEKSGMDLWRILCINTGRLYKHHGPINDFAMRYEAGAA